MKTENLRFLGSLDEAVALAIAGALSSVSGVSRVSISTAERSIEIAFDEDATSMQELGTILNRSGFPVRPTRSDHAGSCCGGCGGG